MLQSKIDEIISKFTQFNSWEDRYRLLIKYGKELPVMDEKQKLEKFKVKGCQSQVWLAPSLKEGKVYFEADSDSTLVKGIVALLTNVYSGEAPQDILSTAPDYLKEIGITEHLSMNRTNGLASMARQIQMYATAFGALVAKGVNNADL